MTMAIILNQQCACLHILLLSLLPRVPQARWYEYDGPCERHQRGLTSVLWNRKKARYSLNNRKWQTNFHSERPNREKGTTFSEFPFVPGIFQWDEPKKTFTIYIPTGISGNLW